MVYYTTVWNWYCYSHSDCKHRSGKILNNLDLDILGLIITVMIAIHLDMNGEIYPAKKAGWRTLEKSVTET